MVFLQLFYEFFKTGLFSIGGGLATLPFLQQIARNYPWYTVAELADMIAISESTPGPIGINMATYVGYTLRGVPGAVTATVGLITPSIIIILIIAKFLQAFKDSPLVDAAFYGLRPASTGLIAAAGLSVLALVLVNPGVSEGAGILELINIKSILLIAVLYYFTAVCKKTKGLHPVCFIAASAVVGIVFQFAGI